jgi:peptidyl-prolyl cis-trans isomerase D
MVIAMVLIIPSFVVTGIYSYNRMNQADNSIAKVGDVSISPQDFDEAKRSQLERLRQQLGDQFRSNMLDSPEARRAIVQQLMDRAALTVEVKRDNVAVSEEQAVALIKSAPALQQDGKFSPEIYERFLQSMGKSDQQFVWEMRQDLARETLLNGVGGTYPVPKTIVRQLYGILTEERTVQTMVLPTETFLEKVTVTDADAQKYYGEHKGDFMADEHVDVQYVVFSPDAFKGSIKPNEEEIKTYYEQNKKRFGVPEQRSASHILVSFGKDKAAAKKQAEEILARVKADPSTFAAEAKAHSADVGSAADGGKLGFFGKGAMVPEFEKAVFSAKKGDILGPVETQYGWHIIKVDDIKPETIRPFDEVSPEIESEYVTQMAMREFGEKAEDFTNLVYEQADSLEPAAKEFGLKIETATDITRNGPKDPALAKIFNDHMVENLFSDESVKEKRNTSALEVGNNILVSARVTKYVPRHQKTFDEVKAEVTKLLKNRRAEEMAKAEGEKKLAELKASKSLEGFGPAAAVARSKPMGLPAGFVNRLIAEPAAKLPAYIGMPIEGGYAIAWVSDPKVKQPTDAEMKALTREFAQIYGEADRTGYLGALNKKLEAKVLDEKFLNAQKSEEE